MTHKEAREEYIKDKYTPTLEELESEVERKAGEVEQRRDAMREDEAEADLYPERQAEQSAIDHNQSKCPKCGDPVKNVEDDSLCANCI